jgi:hypothetical protein
LSAVFSADAAIGSDMFASSIFVKQACKIDRSDQNCAVINLTFGFQNWQAAGKRLYRWYDLVDEQVSAGAVDHGYFTSGQTQNAQCWSSSEKKGQTSVCHSDRSERNRRKNDDVMMVVIIPQRMYACNL